MATRKWRSPACRYPASPGCASACRPAAISAACGVNGDGLACLYVGRLAPEKNLALVRRAFAEIRLRHPQARMVWVGGGPAAAALARAHRDHHFAGVRIGEELAAHYASADLFLFPSLTETYGNVVAEAMASGVPVVAYRSAAAELIVDRENGAIAAPGDENAYIAAALGLLEAAGGLAGIAAAARATMLPCGWANVVECFEGVAREAIAA